MDLESKQLRRNIMGSCDYVLESAKTIKATLSGLSGKKNTDDAWSVAGLVMMITAETMQATQERVMETLKSGDGQATDDIMFIRDHMAAFFNSMLEGQE